MRLRVVLDNPHGVTIPINYQEYLTAAVYGLLATSDTDYARFLHDVGYAVDDGPKRFKLFVFSWLMGRCRPVGDGLLSYAPGPIEWFIASPVTDFLQHCATGLLAQGALRIGSVTLSITEAQTLAPSLLTDTMRFSCLTPIVASVHLEGGGTYYLRPTEADAFSEAIRKNLIRKYQTLHSQAPADDRFQMTFDPAYLEKSKGGTKLMTYKGIRIVGAFCPFTATGSPELMEIMLDCGAGEKNASGFGMAEVKK